MHLSRDSQYVKAEESRKWCTIGKRFCLKATKINHHWEFECHHHWSPANLRRALAHQSIKFITTVNSTAYNQSCTCGAGDRVSRLSHFGSGIQNLSQTNDVWRWKLLSRTRIFTEIHISPRSPVHSIIHFCSKNWQLLNVLNCCFVSIYLFVCVFICVCVKVPNLNWFVMHYWHSSLEYEEQLF